MFGIQSDIANIVQRNRLKYFQVADGTSEKPDVCSCHNYKTWELRIQSAVWYGWRAVYAKNRGSLYNVDQIYKCTQIELKGVAY